MWTKLNIKNFYSHKNTELNLSSGINIFLGNTDSGKSNIIRAIKWLKDNRPLGNSFASYWIRDKKSNIKDEVSVEIQNKRGTVKRYKTKEENGYQIDKQKNTAINSDVPVKVKEMLNLSDVNIQQQFDFPFLLFASPGEVAKQLNKALNLSKIDKVLAIGDSKQRNTKREIKFLEEKTQQLEKEIENLSWVEKAKKFVEKLNRIETTIDNYKIWIEDIRKCIVNIKEIEKEIKNYNKIIQYEELINEYENIEDDIKEKYNKKITIKKYIQNHKEYDIKLERTKKILKLQPEIEEYEKIKKLIKEKHEENESIKMNIEDIKRYNTKLKKLKEEIKDLQSKIYIKCPNCGYKIKEDEL